MAKRTGVQRAAYNLVKTMVQMDRVNEYLIFTGHGQVGRPEWNWPNVKVVPSDIREGESIRNHIWEQFTLPRLAKRHHVDVLHSPANVAPLLYSGKSVVHIHDLCFVVNPQWYSFSFRTLYNFVIPRLARRASKVITNSNNSRNDLLQFFGLTADRVSLVYWAVDDTFTQRRFVARLSGKKHPAVTETDYILYVGSLEPRKNIRTLVEAYEDLRERHPDIKTRLVLIGGESPLFADVRLTIKKFKEDVIFKGFVDDDALAAYYQQASLVVYPSLYEGFGLPPLEAMASGTPVVTSMTSSIPEVVGEAAIMVSPYDVGQLSDTMALVLRDRDLRDILIERGLEQVKKFNWYRVARNTLSVLYEVHNEGQTGPAGRDYVPLDVWRSLIAIEEIEMKKIALHQSR